ncbi:hypothetical protein E4U13_007170, partial [Claviceps humidiphila]
MEGIAIAALQEVRLFKPELSLAEKAILNMKIWTHFDSRDPGSGVATLINTQLATVENYKDDEPIYTSVIVLTLNKSMTGNKRVRYTENVTQKTISTSPVEKMATPTAVDRPMKKKIRTKKRNPAGEGATAPTRSIVNPTKVVQPGFTAKLTKRGKRLATLANVWAVSFTTTDDAMACVGKAIKFGIKDDCTSPVEVQLEKYLTSGPRIFICERQGPITNSEAQQLISSAEFLSGNKFWPKRIRAAFQTRRPRWEMRVVCMANKSRSRHIEVPVFGGDNHPRKYANEIGRDSDEIQVLFTKRGKRQADNAGSAQGQSEGEGLLSNGKDLVFRPPHSKRNIDVGSMIEIVMDSLEKGGIIPENISPVNPQMWTCAFGSVNDARACVGKKISFDAEEVVLERYLTSGPRVFICDRIGPITNNEAQYLIATADFLAGNSFWFGTHQVRGVGGAKRVLVLEAPPEVTTMTFQGPGGYELRFRPENRGGRCEFCVGQKGEDHTTMNCKSLAGTKVPENMPMRLEEKPVVVSTISNLGKVFPIIPEYNPIKIATFNCRSLDFSQLSDLCRWMVMEGIAVAALQEVRLFKPELSLAEKAILNMKIWTHFDPRDPGSGVATLINTQLAT